MGDGPGKLHRATRCLPHMQAIQVNTRMAAENEIHLHYIDLLWFSLLFGSLRHMSAYPLDLIHVQCVWPGAEKA